jgi:AraC-like DNA-binding protein
LERKVWTTAGVSERERFDYWREAVMAADLGVRIEPEPGAERPFEGRIEAVGLAGALCFDMRSDLYRTVRGPREVARKTFDTYTLHCQAKGMTSFGQGGREFVSRPGDLVLGHSDRPFAASGIGHYDFRLWALPRAAVERHLPTPLRARWLHLPGRQGAAALASAYLQALAGQLGTLDSATAEAVLDNLCRLLAIACAGAPPAIEEGREAILAARLEQAKRHIDRHLSDPGLTPASAAAALGISLRGLHLLFEPTGESFAACVRRRLEEARAALEGPGGIGRTVVDVAFAWGFEDLATFHRAFRRAFGATPGELRTAAHGGRGE